jgi:hypothetical protein
VMGTWNVTGHQLIARNFHGTYWLTQRINSNPETFLVRGAEMLTRGDVSLSNGSYSSLVSCFSWPYSNYGGLAVPNSSQFPTPNGFTLAYEPDGTPYYYANNTCSNPPVAPINLSANPGNINSGGSSTLSVTCPIGTPKWSTGSTSTSISVSPPATTTYNVYCEAAGCNDSPSETITVQVGPCSDISHNLVMGTWTVTGHQLVAKNYNGQWWLVQRINSNPEQFLVRGSEMLTRSDVNLTNSNYANRVGCFAWQYSAYGGLATPSTSVFQTPSNWQLGYEPDGTPYYTSTGGARIGSSETIIEEVLPKMVSVYPNPNQGEFKIKIYLEEAGNISIDLINSTGKIYQSQKVIGRQGENEYIFKALNISAGNYHIRAISGSKTESTKVVIE